MKFMKNKDNFFTKNINIIKKKLRKNKNKFNLFEVVICMVITFAVGLLTGGIIMYGTGSFTGHISSSLNEFVSIYNELVSEYYKDIDEDELLKTGLNAMLSYIGDPYTTYIGVDEVDEFNEKLNGSYEGIGAEIIYYYDTKLLEFGTIYETGPAYAAGLKTGDRLLKINGESCEGLDSSQVASTVKGSKDPKVVLTILRDDKEMDIEIVRKVVEIPSVKSEIIDNGDKKVGMLTVSVFADNTDEQFETELKKLEENKIDSLIIDLRGNTGGHLSTVTNMISLFTKKGDVIYQLKTKGDINIYKDKTKEYRDYKIIVLVDAQSASASEVMTVALRDTYGALVVGTNTFGKGKVQKTTTLSSGAVVKYTYQEWLTPKGESIDMVGIVPDYEITDFSETEDLFINKALELLK